MRGFFLSVSALVLTGCQIVSGLSDYEASEEPSPPITSAPFGKHFGGPSLDTVAGGAVAPDGSIVIGGTMSQVDFGSGEPLVTLGNYDPFLAKFDGAGNHLASRSFGTPDGDIMLDMDVGADGRIAVVGLFRSTLSFGNGIEIQGHEAVDTGDNRLSVFVGVLGPAMKAEWAVGLSTFEVAVPVHVALGPDGGVLVAGRVVGTVDFLGESITSLSPDDVFVLSLDRNGAKRWLRHYPAAGLIPSPDNSAPGPAGLAVDSGGNAYVAISQHRALVYAGGTGPEDLAGEIALLKLQGNGTEEWVRFHGGASIQIPTALTLDLAGRPILAGIFFSQYTANDAQFFSSAPDHIDLFVSRFSSAGDHLATTIFPGDAPVDGSVSYVGSLNTESDGSFTGTGGLHGELMVGATPLDNVSSQSNLDVLVFDLDAGLVPTWARRYGDEQADIGVWAGRHPSGNIVVSGYFEGQLEIADWKFSGAGQTDIFLVEYPR